MKTNLTKVWLVTTALLTGSTHSLSASAGTDVDLDEVPSRVRATIERMTRGGVVEDIEWERDARVPYYEVEYELEGVQWELDVAEDGRVLKNERD